MSNPFDVPQSDSIERVAALLAGAATVPSSLSHYRMVAFAIHSMLLPDWRPILTAPRDGTKIITLEGDDVQIAHWDSTVHTNHGRVTYQREGWSNDSGWIAKFPEPTHWLPIPEAPK
jgi:hypothetical protein